MSQPWGRLLAVLTVFVLVAPFVVDGSPYPPAVFGYWTVGIVGAVAIGALPERFLLPAHVRRLLDPVPPRAVQWIAAVLATLVSMTIAVLVFKRAANTPDEIAQYWHSGILARGHLSLPVDAHREFFGLETVVDVGRWYSQFPIGGPLALVPGALVGVPWIVNPILVGIAAALLFRFARLVYGDADARRSALLFATLPMVLFMAGTWMNHVATMLCGLIAVCCLAEWDAAESQVRRWVFAAGIGLALGFAATIRPLDAIALAVPIGVFQLMRLYRSPKRTPEIVAQCAAGLLGVAPLLIANAATTGSPFRFGYDVLWGEGHRVGFHTDPYGRAHTPASALQLLVNYFADLNLYLGAWPVPIMIVVAATLWFWRRPNRWDALMVGLFASQLVAYVLYWGEGSFLGPRFLYTAVPALAVLLARLPSHLRAAHGEAVGRRAGVIMVGCVIVAWLVPHVSFNALGLARQAEGSRANLRVDYRAVVEDARIHNALVFLREPFTARLARRLWGAGALRSDAAQLVATRDACVLHDSLEVIEREGRRGAAAASGIIGIPAFDGATGRRETADPRALVAGGAISPSCAQELSDDQRLGVAPFGPALPLEPITAEGLIGGDVIYAADLGVHNVALRERFAGRRWHRLVLVKKDGGGLEGRIVEY